MMVVGMTKAEQRAFSKLLRTHHNMRITVRVMDLDGNHLHDISNMLLDGQVTIDTTSDVDRTCDLDLLDPNYALHLDDESPAAGAMYGNRMIQVHYAICDPDKTKEYSVPVFTGPVTHVERDGPAISVEAQGKEIFGLEEAWRTRTFNKGVRRITIIRWILTEVMGENTRKLDFPSGLKSKSPRKVTIGDDAPSWQVAQELASAAGYQLFYDARGVCRMRKRPSKAQFLYGADNDTANILTNIQASYSMDDVINCVEVIGVKHKGKKRIRVRAVAPRSNPLSPWRLGRRGGPRYLPIRIEDDGIKTKKEAKRIAKSTLSRYLETDVEVSFDALPIPHLEPGDLYRIHTQDFSGSQRVTQLTIPLTPEAASVGYVRSVKNRKIRKPSGHRHRHNRNDRRGRHRRHRARRGQRRNRR